MAAQILQPGVLVRARSRSWRVVDIRPHGGCHTVTLAGVEANTGASCQLLTPFDLIEPVAVPSAEPRRVGSARWRHALRALLARSAAPGLLRTSIAAAEIDILPHQLEPVVAILSGRGCRVLLADEVGLGKTIQACLIVSELRARGVADRVLILTPPGLRDQWHGELRRRFHLAADIADFGAVRRRAADLPPDVNPWTTWPVAIASIDFIKRPEVLRAVVNGGWDLVIVDEAHRVANDGDRRHAAAALASRAGYVVLLTATPHSGDAVAYRSLCEIGSHGEPPLIFRRTRRVLSSIAGRRIHRLRVASTAAERRMLAALGAFARAVRAERGDSDRDMWIALSLLRKRAFSSAHALCLTATRRLEMLTAAGPAAAQLLLPLDDDGELSSADEAPPWAPALELRDAVRERRLLRALADAAREAAHGESKISSIARLLRRVREPLIIFTEYRDTLAHLAAAIREPAAMLHGGLSRSERAAALDAFAGARTRILLATDAAAEGLNLHHACRLVVNLELPWNPMRLEQRIGRVDRIGQTRTVHAVHLIGRDTGEDALLDELRRRIAGARADVGAPDPLDGVLEDEAPAPASTECIDVTGELVRLRLARALGAASVDDARPLISVARNRHTRRHLGARTLTLWESTIHDGRHRRVSSLAVPTLGAANAGLVSACSETWRARAIATARSFAGAGVARSDAIVRAIEHDGVGAIQPGLFDRRSHFADAALRAEHDDALAMQAERRASLLDAAALTASDPQPRLILSSPR